MLNVDSFTFQYPTASEPALQEVSFEAESGEALGILGPVEAGKTTLAMALSGFVPAITGGQSQGQLSVAGRDPRRADDARVAMVFEDYDSQLTQIRLADEVIAPLTNRGVPLEQAEPRARELLDAVGLGRVPEEKYTWELSGGQQQRLAIAAALASDPDVLVFDTATDMLDPVGRDAVRDLMQDLASETTLVVTENDPDKLVGLADRILVLEGGERRALGPAEEILRDTELLEGIGVGLPTALRVARNLNLPGSPLTEAEFERVTHSAGIQGNDSATSPIEVGADGGTAADTAAGSVDETAYGEPVIATENLSYAYADGTRAVENVDLTVRAGEVHAIVGANGAGKSTLSKLLVGLLNPDEGRVTVAGEDTSGTTAKALAEDVGIALQNPDEQISERTVDAEVRRPLERRQDESTGLFRSRQRYDEAYIDERVQRACSLAGLEERVREKDPLFLPLGARRLVTMAAALGPDPDAIVLDEPTAGVDAQAAETIRNTIDELREAGQAVVIVEHDMEFVCRVADTVSVLNEGTVAMQGPVESVFAQEHWNLLSDLNIRPPKSARLARHVGVNALTSSSLTETVARAGGVTR